MKCKYDTIKVKKFFDKIAISTRTIPLPIHSRKGHLYMSQTGISFEHIEISVGLRNIDLPPIEFAILYPNEISKLLSIMDKQINIEFIGKRTEDDTPLYIKFSDSNLEICHSTVPLTTVRKRLKVNIDFPIEAYLSKEEIETIIKYCNVLNSPLLYFIVKEENQNKFLHVLAGYLDSHNVSMRIDSATINVDNYSFFFDKKELKKIFIRNKCCQKCNIFLSNNAIKIHFTHQDWASIYILPRLYTELENLK